MSGKISDNRHAIVTIARRRATAQLVEADQPPQGEALRLLGEHSRYRFRELTRIRRQQADDYRGVVGE